MVGATSAGEGYRQFDEQKLSAYQESGDFDYEVGGEARSLTDAFKALIRYWLSKVAKIFSISSDTLGNGLMFVLVLAFLFGVFMLFRLKYGASFMSGQEQMFMQQMIPSPDAVVDYQKQMQESLDAGELKMAVRYMYLHLLQSLGAMDELKLSPWKTSMDYKYELSDKYKGVFTSAAQCFQDGWFGDKTLDEASVREVCHSVNEIRSA